jgi:hypothetical protein
LRNKIRSAQDLEYNSLSQSTNSNGFDIKPKLQIVLKNVNPEAFELVLNYIYTDRIDPNKKSADPLSNKIVLLMMDVYTLAVQFHMKRLEQLCVQYLNAAINHLNVLVALQNATQLKLDFIKVCINLLSILLSIMKVLFNTKTFLLSFTQIFIILVVNYSIY